MLSNNVLFFLVPFFNFARERFLMSGVAGDLVSRVQGAWCFQGVQGRQGVGWKFKRGLVKFDYSSISCAC